MKIKDKINLDYAGLVKYGPITIVAFGDSVTHGAVGNGEINYESVYWNRLRKKILEKRNYVPVNVINAGIGGIDAQHSVKLVKNRVLTHNPDLVIVCFGLNDVCGELDDFLSALRTIFTKIKEKNCDVIFMTPNMLNTYVSEDTDPRLKDYAKITAEIQNNGKMDLFMNSAVSLAKELNVDVCDCYAKWKELSKTQDTTKLLANRINHPISEMHELFAVNLMKIIFDTDISVKENDSTMRHT